MGLIRQRFPRSFGKTGAWESSIDSMESIDSVILTFSITHYHNEGPPTFNLAPITAVKGVKEAG
jgi:hypothetical protein